MDERTRRVAENEALFRQVNERVVGRERRPAETFEIVCECADTQCMEHLRVTTEVYERTRSEPTDFLLKPGHAKPEYETMPAKLRMNFIGSHGIAKEDFELFSLAVSAMNGCGMCIDSHERVLLEHGVKSDVIQAAVRIAAVMKAIATVHATL